MQYLYSEWLWIDIVRYGNVESGSNKEKVITYFLIVRLIDFNDWRVWKWVYKGE